MKFASIVFDLFHPVRVEKGSGKRWINLEPIKSSKSWLRGKRGCFPRLLMSRMLSRVNPWAAQRDLKVCGKGGLGPCNVERVLRKGCLNY